MVLKILLALVDRERLISMLLWLVLGVTATAAFLKVDELKARWCYDAVQEEPLT